MTAYTLFEPNDEGFDPALDAASLEPLVVFCFGNFAREMAVRPSDAALHHRMATLPSRDRMTLAYIDRPLAGAALAMALRCAFVAVGPNAIMSSGFGRPGAAAIYAAAANRVGARECERLLFAEVPLTASDALSTGLASFAAIDVAEAIEKANSRRGTMLYVAKANLLTWPFPIEAARALADP